MIEEEIFCSLKGAHFSPKELAEKTSLPLENCLEVGEGRNFLQKIPTNYGKANLVIPQALPEGVPAMTWITQTLFTHYQILLECGVEEMEITVMIDCATGILNWWIDHESMKILGDLRINLAFTASYQEEISISEPEFTEL